MSSQQSLDELREDRNKALRAGFIAMADRLDGKIADRAGDDEKDAAALSYGNGERLHEEIEDVEELKDRHRKAKTFGYDRLADEYGERLAALGEFDTLDVAEDGSNVEPTSEAALEEQKRAALSEPDEETQEITHAALTADMAVQTTDRNQAATQYVYDVYGIDPRDYDDEYELRAALRDAEPKREAYTPSEGVSNAEAALSIGDRNRIIHSETTAEALIQREYDLDPDDYDDVEELREAIRQAGGYSDDGRSLPSRNTAFSDPNDRL